MGVWDFFKKKKPEDETEKPEAVGADPADADGADASAPDAQAEKAVSQPPESEPAETDEPASAWTPGGMTGDADPNAVPEKDDPPYGQIRMFLGDRVRTVRNLKNHLQMLESLKAAYPSIAMFANETPIREDMSKEEMNKALSAIINTASRVFGMTNQQQAAKLWNDLETDTLKDAWVLIDYYSALSGEGSNANFLIARRALGKTLWGRIQKEDIPELNAKRLAGTFRGMTYILQMVEEDWLYILEIHDPSGAILQGAAVQDGQTAFLSFGITKDEYLLRETPETDGARPQVNAFVETMLDRLPQDRLIASGFLDAGEGGRITRVPVKPKCVTMDDFKLAHEKSASITPKLRAMETFYLLYSKATGERFPSIDRMERAWVYTSEDFANKAAEQNKVLSLRVKALSLQEFDRTVRSWLRLGISRFSYNFGFNDHPCDVFISDWLGDASQPLGYEGGALNLNILRFRQNAAVKGNPAAAAASATVWSILSHVISGTLFLVPFNYPGDMFPDDRTLHVTARSSMLLNLRAMEHSLGRRLKPGEKVDVRKVNGTPVLMYDKGMFYGGRDYVLADPAMASLGRPMHYLTVKGGQNTLLCCFTDLEALKNVFKMHVRVAVLTWDEIKAHVGTRISDGSTTNGIVINPGFAELIVNEAQIASIEKERRGSIKIYKPQAEQKDQ